MKYPHRVVLNLVFFLAMCTLFIADGIRGVINPLGGFYGVIAGILLLNAIGWGEQ